MRIAVLSDIHDRVSNLKGLMEKLGPRRPQALLCCGDITGPETLLALAEFPGPVRACLGNCDRESAPELLALGRSRRGLKVFNRVGVMRLEGPGRLAFTHFPETAEELARRGRYRAVFYGHTHRRAWERVPGEPGRSCLLANPGDVQGRFGQPPSALLWDSEGDGLEVVSL